ncbi:MAG: PEGA domain-containing protein [Methanoregula sp.]|nr:PEGA domain-containing protein [Methanoregula sp.]
MNRKIGIIFLIVFVLLAGCVGPDSEKGTLILTSSPSGAECYLDNQYMGSTPVTIPGVEAGAHTLEFRSAGYTSWSTTITVIPGSSNYYGALTPQNAQVSPGNTPVVTPAPAKAAVTISAGKKTMVIGDSNPFSGRAFGTDRVLLTLYGPGKYVNGVSLVQQNVDGLGNWNYLWNPGPSVQAGSFTMIVTDAWKTTSERTEFTVIGGGLVSISPSSYSLGKGDSVTFSGQCTTGAQNVLLVLYGPGQFSGGVELGTFSVSAEKTWAFKYSLDATAPTGTYTMYVYDIPKTTSSNTQFTVGFASSS